MRAPLFPVCISWFAVPSALFPVHLMVHLLRRLSCCTWTLCPCGIPSLLASRMSSIKCHIKFPVAFMQVPAACLSDPEPLAPHKPSCQSQNLPHIHAPLPLVLPYRFWQAVPKSGRLAPRLATPSPPPALLLGKTRKSRPRRPLHVQVPSWVPRQPRSASRRRTGCCGPPFCPML